MNISQNDERFSEEVMDALPSPFSNHSDLIYIDKESNIVIPKNTDFSKLSSQVQLDYSEESFANITYKLGKRAVGTAKLKYESKSIEVSADKQTPDKEVENKSTADVSICSGNFKK